MAQASTTLLIKTEGVTEGYKDIGKLLGPLQGINHMLYNLNKALGISSKESKAYKESLNGATNAGKAAADETKKLQQSLRAAAKDATKLATSGNTLSKAFNFNQIRQALSTVKNDIGLVVNEIQSWIQASETQARVEGSLQASLERNNIKSHINDWRQWAAELQKVTTLGDEQILKLSNIAVQYTKNSGKAKELTKVAMDLAAATGKDATEAMTALLRACNGSERALQSMGVFLTDTEKETFKTATATEKLEIILAKTKKQYAGFSEALANTPEGAIKQVKNIVGDIKEQLGKVLNLPFVAFIKSISLGFQRVLGVTKDTTNNIKLAGQVTNIMGKSLSALPAVLQDIISGAKGIFFVFKGVMQAVNAIKISVAGVGIVISKITKDSELFKDSMDFGKQAENAIDAYEKMYKSFGQGVDDFSKKFDGLGDEMEKTFKNAINDQNSKTITQKWVDDLQAGLDQNDITIKPKVEPLDLSNMFQGQVFDANSMQMMSEQALKIKQDFEQKSLQIEQQFMAQKQALKEMMGVAGDDPQQLQWIREQQIAIEQNYEQQKHDLKIQYAQQTNDQLTIMQDQYYQHIKQKQEEMEKAQTEWANSLKQNIEGGLTNAFTSMFEAGIEGQESLREATYEAFKSMAKNIFTNSISAIVKNIVTWATAAGESQAGIPIVGPILAAAASGAVLATMGLMKAKAGKEARVQYASGGYVSAGMVRGYSNTKKDSVPALLQPGERVLSKSETEQYEKARTENKNMSQIININISGQLSSPAQITDTVRRVLVPELRAAARAGYAI